MSQLMGFTCFITLLVLRVKRGCLLDTVSDIHAHVCMDEHDINFWVINIYMRQLSIVTQRAIFIGP